MLSLESPILAGDIYWVKVWKADKVFQLNGYGTDRVIVKQESSTFSNQDIRMTSFFMAAVDPGAKAIPLTKGELSQLLMWAEGNIPYPEIIPGAGDLLSAINGATPGTPWIKMRAYQVIEADKAAMKLGTGDKTDVRFLSGILNAAGGLEKLGMIMAADFFIGNTDRFTYIGDGTRWPPYPAKQECMLEVIANVGNVFVVVDPEQGKGQMSGLDFLDPNGLFRLQNQDVVTVEKSSSKTWLGRLLAKDNKKDRMEYVHKAVADLNTVLGPRNRKLPFACKERLPTSSSVNRLNFGIEIGAEKLQRTIRGITNLPPALKSRLSVLDWKT